ncbi:MAG: 4-hydroxybenzoate octaprenyltransferase [Chloracidobacterium sp. CP2_5A]|nr:MAG: 4-hydroxybenzoate octaprenyltransferase [Chloracidobacterium sp. CP2_5A]
MSTVLRSVKTTCEMIKIEHTLFALPFAFLGAFLAARGLPRLEQALWITVAMVGARSAAMAFNRLADERYDAANPRTAQRALPAGLVSRSFVIGFTIVAAALLLLAAAMLNPLALWLSPVALASVLLYSYAKRFTSLSHVALGWCLAMAPAGAWVAVRGALDGVAVLLALCVLLWTAGFDILYACQDYDFDRKHPELHSLPKRLGIARAMLVARGLHAAMFVGLVALVAVTGLGWLALVGVAATGALLMHQHRLVSPTDLSRLDAAFFTTNAFVSVILFLTLGIDAAFLSR